MKHLKHLMITAVLLFGMSTFSTGIFPAPGSSPAPGSTPAAQVVALNNKGVGLMGQYNYEAARKIFQSLLEKKPGNLNIKVNLAIATFNRQKEGDEEIALKMLADVLKKDPGHIRAQYCTGLLELYRGQPQKALDFFLSVLKKDPNDAEVLYFTGKTLLQMSRYKEALEYFKRSVARDAYITSNYYGMIMALRQQNKIDDAMAMMKEFQKSKKNPRARLLEFKYTKMGKKANAAAFGLVQQEPSKKKKPRGPLFKSPKTIIKGNDIQWRTKAQLKSSITICDINHDSRLDMFVSGAVQSSAGFGNAVLLGKESGDSFTVDKNNPLANVTNVNAALWGDIDNNGRVDVYLCRKGPNQLWRQNEKGTWQNVTDSTKTANGDLNTVDGALYDADHDGDLDIFIVNADGPNELLNNNRNGTFRPLAKKYGLEGNGNTARSVVITDLDADRDADIIVINSQPPHDVYINHLLWKYTPAKNLDAFRSAKITAAAAADVDTDGFTELYTMNTNQTITRWKPGRSGKWQGSLIKTAGIPASRNFALADIDGDGVQDVTVCGKNGWWTASFDHSFSKLEPIFSSKKSLHAWTFISTPAGPAFTGWKPGASPLLWSPGPGRFNFAMLSFTGRKGSGSQWRSNASGIGSRLSFRVGSRWTVTDTFRVGPGPGQSLQPVNAGLHGASAIDFVAIDWSDGVFQTELGLDAGKLHKINETQRQLSSCPVIFAWNGKTYEFISDFLGVGGIGYAIGPGEYSEPRPWENFMLPLGLLKEKNNRIMIKLTEPMEEVAYMDAVRLKAYDLPQGWSMALDERMGILGPAPTGKPVFYSQSVLPVKAINNRGEDVTALITKRDLKAAPVGKIDRRFIGMLERGHVITLTFPGSLDRFEGRPVLVADGWVEYPYSQTSFAAWQAKAVYEAPTIEVKDSQGKWRVLLEQFGYPAGMPRRMSVPLPKLPAGTREIRIRTNQEIYWDRLAVVFARECPGVDVRELPLRFARLEQVGYPERPDLPQRLPYYDFDKRKPLWDTRLLEGYYTKFGEIGELLEAKDNALAIFGAGEGIHLEFESLPPPPAKNTTRVYVLETQGWCKDIDLYTNTGQTIEPVPHSGKITPKVKRLHETYNTRYLSGKE